ncbi:MAG: hypothetical protein QOK44_37 [Betaproteobacteria bacterium]|nr:hypothetical protein [Betaproteobacteria bacterium]
MEVAADLAAAVRRDDGSGGDSQMMTVRRAVHHLVAPPWLVRRAFPKAALDRIEAAVTASEQTHRGEIRFAVEGALEFLPVLHGLTAHQRALDVFSLLRVWDTEENTGVLIYLQVVDREIEIVADRGIAHRIPQHQWDAICRRMETAFAQARYDEGVIAGIAEVSELLARHFPAGTINPDELPNKPAIL